MKRKLGINTDCLRGQMDELATLELACKTGFGSFTTGQIELEAVAALKKKADGLGMEFPFLHAPYKGINNMWLEGDGYRTIWDGMIQAIDSAAACGVPAVVIHASSGWKAPNVNDLGLSRFDALVEHAAAMGVIVALENLRMVGNLACLLDRYEGNPFVRCCFDCGHEHCYTNPVSWLDIFAHNLVATHIHDNMGRPLADKSTDRDVHWLPFDGTYNYHDMMRKLNTYGYEGSLTLEVFQTARNDYKNLTAEAFIATCYERIQRISEMGF